MFKHNFGNKENKDKQKQEKKLANVLTFKCSIEGIATLKDGGVNLRLGLSEQEYINIAKLLLAKSQNKLLDIVAEVVEPEIYG